MHILQIYSFIRNLSHVVMLFAFRTERKKFCDYGHSIENSGAKMTYREQNKFKEIVLFSLLFTSIRFNFGHLLKYS